MTEDAILIFAVEANRAEMTALLDLLQRNLATKEFANPLELVMTRKLAGKVQACLKDT